MSRIRRAGTLLLLSLLATQCIPFGSKPEKKLPRLKVDPFAGLDPLGTDTDEEQSFSFRKGPTPPPRVGEQVKLPFPRSGETVTLDKPPAPPALKVLRTRPSGKGGLIGAVTATFNQPMVAVATLDELAAQRSPLEILPKVEGRVRWIGTQTVAFEPRERLPFGTTFTARILPGTRALSGKPLAEEVSWTFTTPVVKLVKALPGKHRPVKPDTAIAMLFNQPMDRGGLINLLELGPGPTSAVELVPPAKWPELKYIGESIASWDAERTVVFMPRRALPLATNIQVKIRAGLKGEGPLPTIKDIYHHFSTYGPLEVKKIKCGSSRCNPEAGFAVRFSNPLITTDLARFIKVTPAPKDLSVVGRHMAAFIRGSFPPKTAVTLVVRRGLQDTFGQELATPVTRVFTTGDLRPRLAFPSRSHVVLERHGPRRVPVHVAGISRAQMRMVRVPREQLLTVLARSRRAWNDDGKKDPLAEIKGRVVKRTLNTKASVKAQIKIDLRTDEGLGRKAPGVLYIELRSKELKRRSPWATPYRGLVVSVTDIGLMAVMDHDKILVMATSLQTGQPLPGCKLELRSKEGEVLWQGAADQDGVVQVPGRRGLKERPPYVLWAEHGRDEVFLVMDGRGSAGQMLKSYTSWGYAPAQKHLKMFLFTDRDPYRPGETVHLKGILRLERSTPRGGVEAIPPSLKTLTLRVTSARNRKVLERTDLPISPGGAFAVDVSLEEDADLGRYSVHVKSSEGSAESSFQVEEYRPPEFEVKVEAGEGPYFFGDTLLAKVGADYLFGAPMSGAPLSWILRRTARHFTPPHNEGFVFGEAAPRGINWFRRLNVGRFGEVVQQGEGELDQTGRLSLKLKLEPPQDVKRRGAAAFTLEGSVEDHNRQMVANRQVIIVHPASVAIGLRLDQRVVQAGKPMKISTVVTGLTGKRLPGRALPIRAFQLKTKMTPVKQDDGWGYRWETQEVEVDQCALTSGVDPVSCKITLKKPGAYLLRAELKDDKGRVTHTAMRAYVYGPGTVPWRLENQTRLELVADKEIYNPGDVARVLVKSPLAQSIGFVTISRSGIAEHRTLRMQGNAQVVEVPIKDHYLPEIHVGVGLSRGRVKMTTKGQGDEDLGRPTFASGSLRLPVRVAHKELAVSVKPAQRVVRPSQVLDVAVQTRDHRGRPVPGEVALMVVDEGVLSLLGYQTPDPLAFFFSSRKSATLLKDSRAVLVRREAKPPRSPSNRGEMVQRALPLTLGSLRSLNSGSSSALAGSAPGEAAISPGSMSGKMAKGGGAPRIRARSLFATTAYYNPSVITDNHGQATVKVKMPDNLTTFRIMAVALDRGRSDRFGKGEAQVKVRKPLLLRPALPRFLSVGDTFEAAVVVHNQTAMGGMVDVLARARNIKAPGRWRKRVFIEAGAAEEVRFEMSPVTAGPARIQFAAVLKGETDAVEQQLPVVLPATTEAFATYGVTDGSVAQSVVPPQKVLTDYGGLEISMSSTALTNLEDAVRYLVDYPYECTEQIASRVLPIFSLGAILKDFKIASLADQARQQKLARAGVRKLLSNQRWDGGWGSWSGSRDSRPYLTAYVVFVLQRAKEAGFPVFAGKMRQAVRYLKKTLDRPRGARSEQQALVERVISVWALSELKELEIQKMTPLYAKRSTLPLFVQVWLMQALFRAEGRSPRVQTLIQELGNRAVETPSAAHFAEKKTESLRLLMHSVDRTDAIALYALLEVDPGSPLIPKLAQGLIQSRVNGRWSTTQANAFSLAALARYYALFEKDTPSYVTRLWLGRDGFLGQSKFQGRQMRVVQKKVPMSALTGLGEEELIFTKQGRGKLYYRVGLRYAPENHRLPPEDQGFAVSRSYEPLTGEEDSVKRLKDGTWRIKAGSTVRVRLTVVVPGTRYYVALADPLPAGLEGINMSFATSAGVRLRGQRQSRTYDTSSWYARSWYARFAFNHREIRDKSVVLFADRLPAGIYETTYFARATTLGRFVAAPSRAEEMYHPETFGRTATAIVEIK